MCERGGGRRLSTQVSRAPVHGRRSRGTSRGGPSTSRSRPAPRRALFAFKGRIEPSRAHRRAVSAPTVAGRRQNELRRHPGEGLLARRWSSEFLRRRLCRRPPAVSCTLGERRVEPHGHGAYGWQPSSALAHGLGDAPHEWQRGRRCVLACGHCGRGLRGWQGVARDALLGVRGFYPESAARPSLRPEHQRDSLPQAQRRWRRHARRRRRPLRRAGGGAGDPGGHRVPPRWTGRRPPWPHRQHDRGPRHLRARQLPVRLARHADRHGRP
jgi:hypothetical protein